LPESGLGVAIKIDDGAARASEVAMAGVIERFVPLDDEDRAALGGCCIRRSGTGTASRSARSART
jgi:L-asparaginase II